jgi:hypothetical protein
MKKVCKYVAMLTIAVTTSVAVNAQESTFVEGDNIVGVSIGFGGYYRGLGAWDNVRRVPALTLYYDACLFDNLFDEKSSLGIGGILGYASAKVKDSWKSSHIVIGARSALHYALVNKLDTYAGVMLGYDIYSWKWIGIDMGNAVAGGGFDYSLFLGARYYLTDNFAGFAEIGYGTAILNLGLNLKF